MFWHSVITLTFGELRIRNQIFWNVMLTFKVSGQSFGILGGNVLLLCVLLDVVCYWFALVVHEHYFAWVVLVDYFLKAVVVVELFFIKNHINWQQRALLLGNWGLKSLKLFKPIQLTGTELATGPILHFTTILHPQVPIIPISFL